MKNMIMFKPSSQINVNSIKQLNNYIRTTKCNLHIMEKLTFKPKI